MPKPLTCIRAFLFVIAVLATLASRQAAVADQQITLVSGTVLVGQVTMDGKDLVINIDGAKLHVSFSDVATVTAVGTDSEVQARRLLLKGLESQLLFSDKERGLGLLAEAYRLSPEDTSVAFWYARSLATAGHGKTANKVFGPRSEAFAEVYPEMADRLAAHIKQRLATESLPEKLVRRIDQLNASSLPNTPFISESDLYAAYFQLVDQENKPIPVSAFRVECSGGQNVNLEPYADGYYFYTFSRRRSYSSQSCKINILDVELAKETIEFNGARNGVQNAGVFKVRRFTDADRIKVDVLVLGPDSKPLPDATATFSAYGNRGYQKFPPVKTDSTGHASAALFPAKYSYYVTAEGYTRASKQMTISSEKQDPMAIEIQLHRQIQATVKVVWKSRLVQNSSHSSSQTSSKETVLQGETELYSTGTHTYDETIHWLRMVQLKDVMQLSLTPTRYSRTPNAENTWMGRLVDVAEASEFDAVDLDKLDELKAQAKLPKPNLSRVSGQSKAITVPIEKGAIYVGRIHTQDSHTNQPAVIDFKVLVVKATESD